MVLKMKWAPRGGSEAPEVRGIPGEEGERTRVVGEDDGEEVLISSAMTRMFRREHLRSAPVSEP